MTVMKGFFIVILSSIVFGLGGASIGYTLGLTMPGYYRGIFGSGREPWFDPVAVGLGLGLTQGLICGVVVGAVIVLAVAWYNSRRRALEVDRHGDPLPPGALLRLSTIGFRAETYVTSVAISRDGKWVAAGDSAGLVYLWEASSGRVVRQMQMQQRWPMVFFSHDSQMLGARDGDGHVCVWSIGTGKVLGSFDRGKIPGRVPRWAWIGSVDVSAKPERPGPVGGGRGGRSRLIS
jgi:hypothetical protein